jgi:PTS system cellobiose-specific IIB component
MLMCSAGMSTSMLEKKIQEYVKANNLDISVIALSAHEGQSTIDNYDVVLLGPQVRYMLDNVKKMFKNPARVDVIPPAIYALANAQETVKIATELFKK